MIDLAKIANDLIMGLEDEAEANKLRAEGVLLLFNTVQQAAEAAALAQKQATETPSVDKKND